MSAWLPDTPLLLAFVGASLALSLTPGPAVAYILARTLAHGRRSGLASVAGVALGNAGNALGAALGLAVLLAVSSAVFTVVKLAGAAYLVWLGMRLLRQAHAPDLPQVARRQGWLLFRDGFVVALLNPKTTLFFAAFLPQFVTPATPTPTAQTLVLGGLFVLIAACTDCAYVLLSAVLAPRLHRAARARAWGHRVAGGAFIGLGLLAAFTQKPVR